MFDCDFVKVYFKIFVTYDEGFFLIIFVGGILVGDGFEVGGGVFDV